MLDIPEPSLRQAVKKAALPVINNIFVIDPAPLYLVFIIIPDKHLPPRPSAGWLKATRTALGMSTRSLGVGIGRLCADSRSRFPECTVVGLVFLRMSTGEMTLDTTLSITIAMSMVLALVITKAAVSGWWRAPETWIVGVPVIAGILY